MFGLASLLVTACPFPELSVDMAASDARDLTGQCKDSHWQLALQPGEHLELVWREGGSPKQILACDGVGKTASLRLASGARQDLSKRLSMLAGLCSMQGSQLQCSDKRGAALNCQLAEVRPLQQTARRQTSVEVRDLPLDADFPWPEAASAAQLCLSWLPAAPALGRPLRLQLQRDSSLNIELNAEAGTSESLLRCMRNRIARLTPPADLALPLEWSISEP